MLDLNSILGMMTGNIQQRQTGILDQANQQAIVTDEIALAGQRQIAETRDLLAEQNNLKQAQSALTLQRAQVNEAATKMIGLDPADLNNEFAKSIAEMNVAEERRRAAKKEYDQYAGATILSDPFTWLAAQVALPELANQVNSAADERDAAISNLQTRHSLLNTQKSVVTAATARQAHELEVQEAALMEKDARIRLLSAESKLSSDIAGRRLNEFNLRNNALTLDMESLDKSLSIEELGQRRQERAALAAERREAAAARHEALNERNAEKAEKAALEASFDVNLQRATQLLGLPTTLTWKQLNAAPIPREQKEILANVALTGQLGDDIEGVLMAVSKISTAMPHLRNNNPMFAQTVENVTTAVDSYVASIATKPNAVGKMPTTKEAVQQGFAAYEDEILKAANVRGFSKPMNHPAWDSTYHPHKVNHKLILQLADSGSAGFLKENMYTKAVRGVASTVPAERETFRGEDENKALLAMVEHVKRRDLLPKEAAKQIAQYYSASTFIQADQTQSGIFNIPLPKRYHVTIPASSSFGQQRTVDLMNPAEVEKMLLEEARAEAFGPLNLLTSLLEGATQFSPGTRLLQDASDPAFRNKVGEYFRSEQPAAR